MKTFNCPNCGKEITLADDLPEGKETTCPACGTVTVSPTDLPFDDGPVTSDAATLTLAELEALRKEMRRGQS